MRPARATTIAAKAATLLSLFLSVAAPACISQTVVPNSGIEYGAPAPGRISHGAGTMAKSDVDQDLGLMLDQLLSAALKLSADSTELDREVSKYRSRTQKSRFGAQDILLNYLGLPRGFDYSEEGAHLVLGDNNSVKNLEAAVWGRQIRTDQMHESITTCLMEMASGLGQSDPRAGQAEMQAALSKLSDLCGAQDAAQAASLLCAWSKNVKLSDSAFNQPLMSLTEVKSRAHAAAALAFEHDLTMIALKNKLHTFCDHSKARQVGGKLMEGTVSAVTMLGPGLGVPVAAQAVGATWGLANGGSEETKLLKELYYQKQVDSRQRLLEVEADMALLSLKEAVQTHNQPLLIFSEALLAQLVGASGMQQVLPVCAIDHRLIVSHTIALPD